MSRAIDATPSLFDGIKPRRRVPTPLGETFDAERDGERLGNQYAAVRDLMADGIWRTLATIAAVLQAPEASVSARLRDMRRDGFDVSRRRVSGGGLNEYRATRRAS